MQRLLLVLAWSGFLGAMVDGSITAYAAWEVANSDEMGLTLTVDQHLKDHLSFLYWLKDVAYFIMPDGLVDWLFGLPALVYFPVRILVNILFGYWMLFWARSLQSRPAPKRAELSSP